MYNEEKKTNMNKKRYMAPQMEIMMVETQGFIATSFGSLSRGKVSGSGDDDYDESEIPTATNGCIFGD